MDELKLIAAIGRDVPIADDTAKDRARAVLLAAIEAEVAGAPGTAGTVAPARPVRARRRLRVVVPLVAAALALVLALPALLPSGSGLQTAAADALRELSVTAASQPPPDDPEPGQFLHLRTRGTVARTISDQNGSRTVLEPLEREAWIGADGSGRSVVNEQVTRYGPGELTRPDVSELSTDPARLADQLESRRLLGGPAGDAETFDQIADLLRITDASPELRSALFRVAAELPGVELVGEVNDQDGREGIAVEYPAETRTLRLIFDADTSALLAEETKTQTATGSITEWRVYSEPILVDSDTTRGAP